jgi:hypothetical protein
LLDTWQKQLKKLRVTLDMIGRRRLAAIANLLDQQGSGQPCQGEFVLYTQRLLYGSETAQLTAEETVEVIAYLMARRRRGYGADRYKRPDSRFQTGASRSIRDIAPPPNLSHALTGSRQES